MLSSRIRELKPSPTLALAALARQLKSEGHDVIALSVGEPDWNTFDKIIEAGVAAIQEGATKYVPASGIMELREAVADMTSRETEVEFTPNHVTVSVGGKFVLFSAFQSLIDPGDEVIIPAPYWVSYPEMVRLAGGVPVIVEGLPENQFKVTDQQLESAITEKTKILLMNSPSNPTGEIYSKEELKKLGHVLASHSRVVVVSDDIYNKLVFDGSGTAPNILNSNPELRDRVLIINGASKSYSMTGWRVGWGVGPENLIKAMTSYQSQSVSCTPGFCQFAAVEAIQNGGDDLKSSVSLLKDRRDFTVEKINQVDGFKVKSPGGAFYLWTDVSKCLGKTFKGQSVSSTREFCKFLLEDQKVAVVPGVEFGQEGFVRISYAIDKDRMGEAVRRMSEFVQQLQ